jgi:universal stress protein E
VDFSPTSLRALKHAAALATQDGAELRVVHVFDPPWAHLHYRMATPEATPEFQRSYRDALERRLKATVEESGVHGATCDVFASEGHRSGIVEYAGSVRADLLVIGTRGRTNLRDMLLGSTAEKALRESTCSVLAVKPTADDLRQTEALHPPQPNPPGAAPNRPAF